MSGFLVDNAFCIRALTKVGTDALYQCIQEEKVELSKRSILERMKFHKIWKQEIKRDPLTYTMRINPSAERFLAMDPNFTIKSCVSEVNIAMTKNGASLDQDYVVEVFHG